VEKAAWKSFKNVTTNFGGNHTREKSYDMEADIVKSYKAVGFTISLQARFLDFHLSFFPKNLRTVSDEQGDRFQ